MHLYSLRRTVAELRISMTVVTIKEQSGENVRFPGAPIVVVSYHNTIAVIPITKKIVHLFRS